MSKSYTERELEEKSCDELFKIMITEFYDLDLDSYELLKLVLEDKSCFISEFDLLKYSEINEKEAFSLYNYIYDIPLLVKMLLRIQLEGIYPDLFLEIFHRVFRKIIGFGDNEFKIYPENNQKWENLLNDYDNFVVLVYLHEYHGYWLSPFYFTEKVVLTLFDSQENLDILIAFLINAQVRKKMTLIEEKADFLLEIVEKKCKSDSQVIFQKIFENEITVHALWSLIPLLKRIQDLDFLLVHFDNLYFINEKALVLERIENLNQFNRLTSKQIDPRIKDVYEAKKRQLLG